MRIPYARMARRRGAAAVELAMLSPLLVALLLGIWEVGRLIQVNQILSNAAREGGRQASTGRLTNTQVQAVVKQYVKNAGLPDANVTVTLANLTDSGRDAPWALQHDQFQVEVTIPTNDVKWVALNLITNSSSTLKAKTVWYSIRDKEYPSTITPPSGS